MDEQQTPTTPSPSPDQISAKKSYKTHVIIVVVIAILAVVGYVMSREEAGSQAPTSAETNSAAQAPSEAPPMADAALSDEESVKTFTIEGDNFKFSLPEIRVAQGDRVKIVFINKEGFHDIVIDEFNARTPKLKAGETAEFEFTPDMSGEFEYYCSVGSHRAMGMKGKLIVE